MSIARFDIFLSPRDLGIVRGGDVGRDTPTADDLDWLEAQANGKYDRARDCAEFAAGMADGCGATA